MAAGTGDYTQSSTDMTRILWKATRLRTRTGSEPGFEVEFETDDQTFKVDGNVPPEIEFLRGRDLRYHADVCKRQRVEITFVKFIRGNVESRTTFGV